MAGAAGGGCDELPLLGMVVCHWGWDDEAAAFGVMDFLFQNGILKVITVWFKENVDGKVRT